MARQDFNKLKKHWYAKLAKSGFKDIEDFNNPDGKLIGGSHYPLRQGEEIQRPSGYEAKRDYYYLGNQFLLTHDFKTEIHRTIWQYHVEGISVRDIAEILHTTKIPKVRKIDKMTVWNIIAKYRLLMKKEMKIK